MIKGSWKNNPLEQVFSSGIDPSHSGSSAVYIGGWGVGRMERHWKPDPIQQYFKISQSILGSKRTIIEYGKYLYLGCRCNWDLRQLIIRLITHCLEKKKLVYLTGCWLVREIGYQSKERSEKMKEIIKSYGLDETKWDDNEYDSWVIWWIGTNKPELLANYWELPRGKDKEKWYKEGKCNLCISKELFPLGKWQRLREKGKKSIITNQELTSETIINKREKVKLFSTDDQISTENTIK